MSAASPNARWLAIYIPRIRTDRLIRAGRGPSDGRPLAVYSKDNGALQLKGIDARASALGLTLAMSLADARAIQPKLEAVEADPEEDTRALDNIAAWCERFTPIVVLDPPEGLFLDITGCAHLFGGEEKLRAEIVTRLHAQGFGSRAAIHVGTGDVKGFTGGRIDLDDDEVRDEIVLVAHGFEHHLRIELGIEGGT